MRFRKEDVPTYWEGKEYGIKFGEMLCHFPDIPCHYLIRAKHRRVLDRWDTWKDIIGPYEFVREHQYVRVLFYGGGACWYDCTTQRIVAGVAPERLRKFRRAIRKFDAAAKETST